MSRRVITSAVLLLVVMMCCGTGGAKTEEVKLLSDPKFKWKGITEGDGVTVDSLGAPSLLKVGSDVFAVAEAQCKKGGGNSFTGVASQLLTKKTTDKPEEVLKDAKDGTQFLEEDGSEVPKKKVDVSRPTTAVKGNDIYMLVGKYGSKVAVPGPDAKPDAAQLGLLLVKGSVNSGEDTSNNKIDWKDNENPPQRLFDAQLGSWTRLIGSGGSGVKMEDETLVFPVEGTKKKAEDAEEEEKTVSLIIYSTDNTNWTLSKGMSDGGCSDPSVVEWEKDKLMMMTECDDGRRRVYESGDKGASWTEALGTLSRVWGNKQGNEKRVGSGFTTANIVVDGGAKRNVMLVTLPAYAEEGNKKGKLHLWLTDNTHIVYIGPVSGDEDVTASSLLYKSAGSGDKKEELIALYEKKKDVEETSHSLWSVLLTEQLQRVKKVLAAWKKADDRVSQLCATLLAQEERASTDTDCDAVKITDGLVGFLSDKFSDGIWRDEYLGVNATAKNGAAAATGYAEKGVTFQGAWAEWPVGSQGENQLYHFANHNFTLVATVSIDKVPEEGNIPLMGAKVNDSGKTVLLGLSYNKEKKWQLLCSGGPIKELSSTWEPEETHQLAIVLQNGTHGSAYVDGKQVGDAPCALGNGESKEISHFYIGGDGDGADDKESRGDVSVTVTNVLLYNRPWDDTEIGAFNPNKADILVEMDRPVEGDAIQFYPGGGKEEPRQLLGSSGTGGISTPTVSSATTSSGGGKESVMQVVSEKSSDGHKNVGGGSFSDGDPTVETREEGTDGQEEEVNTQVREVNATALSSSLGNVPQGNNSDAGTMRGSGMVPSLLLLLLGLLGLAAL